MVKKVKFWCFLLLIFCCSCSISSLVSSSFSTASTSYERDEEGFYKLDEKDLLEEAIEDNKEITKLRISGEYEEKKYNAMRLYAGDKQIPIYNVKTNYTHQWTPDTLKRMNNAVSVIELEGKMTFRLQTNFLIHNIFTIRPLSRNVPYNIDEQKRLVTFTISEPGAYTIEFRNDKTLHLFVHPYEAYNQYKNDTNVLYFAPGIYNKDNCSYIQNDHMIHLNSNTTVYLELGAILECGFVSNNASHIKIVGSGIVDGSSFIRNATTNERLIPFDFNYCTDIQFLGITTLDPAGWCYNIYFCDQVTFKNVAIISSRSNGDGISLQSSKNVVCKNAFVRSFDDSLVVKNYPRWNNMTSYGSTYNIQFKNCILWTDLAQSMEVGYETYGEQMEDIHFENITVLHNFHKAPISIHNANQAKMKNISFKDITIEDASMGEGDGSNLLIDFSCAYSSTWSNGHGVTPLGSIDQVMVQNVKVLSENKIQKISIMGSVDTRENYKGSVHKIQNVTLQDIQIVDEKLQAGNARIMINEYVESLKVMLTGNEITGATYQASVSANAYGKNYQIIEVQ